jgi:hypothetical protein
METNNQIPLLPDSEFWAIIELSKNVQESDFDSFDQGEAFIENITQSLTSWDDDDIIRFELALEAKAMCLDHYQILHLYKILDIAFGGMSDDGFHYFKHWIIYMGENFFNTALQNIDQLKFTHRSFVAPDFETLLDVASQAWEIKHGEVDSFFQILDSKRSHETIPLSQDLKGIAVKRKDYKKHYPNLMKQFRTTKHLFMAFAFSCYMFFKVILYLITSKVKKTTN